MRHNIRLDKVLVARLQIGAFALASEHAILDNLEVFFGERLLLVERHPVLVLQRGQVGRLVAHRFVEGILGLASLALKMLLFRKRDLHLELRIILARVELQVQLLKPFLILFGRLLRVEDVLVLRKQCHTRRMRESPRSVGLQHVLVVLAHVQNQVLWHLPEDTDPDRAHSIF